MNRAACLLVIWSLIPIQSHAEDKPIGELSALEKKLCESWQGTGPCDGRLILHANGTYERQFYGPAGINSQGRWTLRWEELPPALTLHCQKSDDADDVGTSRSWKLVTLNGAALVITQEASQRQTTFKRVAK